MELSVIVPCYNEQETLEEFYQNVKDVFTKEKITYELIFVDDGSEDDTFNILEKISLKDKDVKVISFSRNFGKESAMQAGLLNASLKYVSIIDADMQQKPEVLVMMYKKLLDNKDYDCVAAYRENRLEEKRLKRSLTSMFYRINNTISDVKLLPGASDFRVFKSEAKDAIISLKEHDRFLKGIFGYIGFNTIYMPYKPEKRAYGTSKWSIIKLLKYSLGGILSFSPKIIKIVSLISFVAFLVCFLNFILLGNLSFRTILFMIGLILLFISVLSLYILRIYNNTLNRPQYIIKRKLGFSKKATK